MSNVGKRCDHDRMISIFLKKKKSGLLNAPFSKKNPLKYSVIQESCNQHLELNNEILRKTEKTREKVSI